MKHLLQSHKLCRPSQKAPLSKVSQKTFFQTKTLSSHNHLLPQNKITPFKGSFSQFHTQKPTSLTDKPNLKKSSILFSDMRGQSSHTALFKRHQQLSKAFPSIHSHSTQKPHIILSNKNEKNLRTRNLFLNSQNKMFHSSPRVAHGTEPKDILKQVLEENENAPPDQKKQIFTIDRELFLPLFVSPYALYPDEKLSVRVYDEAQLSFFNWHQKLPENHPYHDVLGFVPSLESSEELVYGRLPRLCNEKVGTLVRVLENNDIPNGKHLYLHGLKRFKVKEYEKNPENNFFQASVTYFDDINAPKSSAKFEGVEEVVEEKEDEERIKELQLAVENLLIADIQREEYETLQLEGAIPLSTDLIEYSYWLGSAIPRDQISYEERLRMFATRSTIERYEIAERVLRKMVESKSVLTIEEDEDDK